MTSKTIQLTMLPTQQGWDCHTCGSCCKEYQVSLTPDEAARIESLAQEMREELGGQVAVRRTGWGANQKVYLNHTQDGACVFLGDGGRCRLHARHGYESKPLPCRLFPWVLVPFGSKWAVSVRFACPSAAENKGRPIPAHTPELESFAEELVQREGVRQGPDGAWVPPPNLDGITTLTWDKYGYIREKLLEGLSENRPTQVWLLISLRWIGHLSAIQKIEQLTVQKFRELGEILWKQALTEVEKDLQSPVVQPDALAGLVFRQCAAVRTRKDHGPKKGVARDGVFARLGAILRFSVGRGKVPKLHGWLPDADFSIPEIPGFQWPKGYEEVLRRYYLIKVHSGQFAGTVHHRMSIRDGFSSLALTYPVICWIERLSGPSQAWETLIRALSIVDDHFGFNKVLGGFTQRVFLKVLATSGRLGKLIRWYSPERR